MPSSEQGDLSTVALKSGYDTEYDDIVRDLYGPCLRNSVRYDRAVGYFRANIYRELGEELLDFVVAGGHVRIVCSPDIPSPDEAAAREGYERRTKVHTLDLGADLVATIDAMAGQPTELDCLNMLRLLIERGSLDLYVAVRPGGIYHRKIGRFADILGNQVVFSGSGNETAPAVARVEDWSNDEEFDVFRSWGEIFEKEKARAKSAYLDRLFCGGTAHTKVRPLNEVERQIIARYRSFDSLDACRPGAKARSRRIVARASTVGERVGIIPYFYQEQAIERWVEAGRIGMLSMATGTGKTLTALLAIRPLIELGRLVLIVVPSSALFEQWDERIRTTYESVPVLRAGAGHDWKADPSKRMFILDTDRPRLILATMQTASSPDFLEFIGQAVNAALVADEAHRLGSENNRKLLKIPFGSRLGLSATPERLFDQVGEQALESAFGSRPVFSLPLGGNVRLSRDDPREVPILGRFLSRYDYGFETLELTSAEQAEWDRLRDEIRRLIARNQSTPQPLLFERNDLKSLLIRRARIVKLASQKVDVAAKVVRERYPEGGRWIVYCEDEEQLRAVVSRIRREHPSVAILPYHSKLPPEEREAALRFFQESPSIMVSIRCLDEGVDLPAADGGLILASSSNPREYVQRRGRLLRTSVGKVKALIIDAIVLPRMGSGEDEVPVSIVRGELARAFIFAKDADNVEVTHDLWKLCVEYGVNLAHDAEVASEEGD